MEDTLNNLNQHTDIINDDDPSNINDTPNTKVKKTKVKILKKKEKKAFCYKSQISKIDLIICVIEAICIPLIFIGKGQ